VNENGRLKELALSLEREIAAANEALRDEKKRTVEAKRKPSSCMAVTVPLQGSPSTTASTLGDVGSRREKSSIEVVKPSDPLAVFFATGDGDSKQTSEIKNLLMVRCQQLQQTLKERDTARNEHEDLSQKKGVLEGEASRLTKENKKLEEEVAATRLDLQACSMIREKVVKGLEHECGNHDKLSERLRRAESAMALLRQQALDRGLAVKCCPAPTSTQHIPQKMSCTQQGSDELIREQDSFNMTQG